MIAPQGYNPPQGLEEKLLWKFEETQYATNEVPISTCQVVQWLI